MSAPKKNQFWRLRSKHGRDKLFTSPELLWTAAEEYFLWCDGNPWLKKEAIKSGERTGDIIDIPAARPYSLSGLCLYLGACEVYWWQFKAAEHEGFEQVIAAVEQVIETQQFEGAVVGVFNANIISRKLGLVDRQDVAIKATADISRSELNTLSVEQLKKIESIIDGIDGQ